MASLDHSRSSGPASPPKQPWRRGCCVLIFLCLGCLLQAGNHCHINSFFNRYAFEVKGLTSTEYGVVMASYCFVTVLVTPLTAKLVDRRCLRDKTIMFIGWSIDGLFGVIMSFTYVFGPGIPFFIGTLIIRMLEASGMAMGMLMLYVITGLELNNVNHIVIPLLETIYGTSVVAAPALSGFLYDSGGYPLPFWVMGGLLLLTAVLALCFFPEPTASAPDEGTPESVNIRGVWTLPIIVNVLCTMSAFLMLAFNETTLALRLHEKFGMNATESGLLFLFDGGMYAIVSLLLGFISKKITDLRYLLLLGQLLSLAGLVLQGPLIPIEQTKVVVIVAQTLLGVGAGPSYVCSYLQSLRDLSDGQETKEKYAALSAVYTPVTSIGYTIGPLLAGLILEYYLYETAVTVIAMQAGFMAVLLFATICLKGRNVKKN